MRTTYEGLRSVSTYGPTSLTAAHSRYEPTPQPPPSSVSTPPYADYSNNATTSLLESGREPDHAFQALKHR